MLLSGCGDHQSKDNNGSANEDRQASTPVKTMQVEAKNRTLVEEVAGTVRPKLRATIEARLSGRVESMPVVLGGKVKKGQLVAKLDVAEIRARLDQAEASLTQAEQDWKRVSLLYEQKSATQSEYDAAQARRRIAAGAAAEARAMMGYVDIVAPFDGVVTRKRADMGDLAAPGKPLMDIEDLSVLQLDADLPETLAPFVKNGSRLTVRADGGIAEALGTVSEISPASDPVSRTLQVKVDLPDQRFTSGKFARLVVPIGEFVAVRIPREALQIRGQMELVFSVQEGRAKMKLVRVGKTVGNEVEITSGLEPGTIIVLTGAEKLQDGQKVEAK